jgi:hypothetical protein
LAHVLWLDMGFGLVIGFIDYFQLQVIITVSWNYTLYRPLYWSPHKLFFVFTSCCLIMAPIGGDSSASVLILIGWWLSCNSSWPQLTELDSVFVLYPWHRLHRKHCSEQFLLWFYICCHRYLYIKSLPSNCYLCQSSHHIAPSLRLFVLSIL